MDEKHIRQRAAYHKAYNDPVKRKRIRQLANARYKPRPRKPKKYSQTKVAKFYREYNKKRDTRNKTRTPEMWQAHNIAEKIPLKPFCELCPDDDLRKSELRHHFDYAYPTLFLSLCRGCHTALHKMGRQKRITRTQVVMPTLLSYLSQTSHAHESKLT